MGAVNPIVTSFKLEDGREVFIETGKLATQAHGSVVVRVGKTMLFASVVSNHEAKEGQSFFPLSVDYQEKFAAVGRIPGNFFRRETRLSDYEILISRLVDRAIRPLFPDGYMNETQVIINLISSDGEELPDAYAALATSAALLVSDIPWAGPISEVRVAKIGGKFEINPSKTALKNASMDIIVAATMNDVMMVEGEAKECQESELVEAIRIGHESIKKQCQAQLDLAQLVGDKALVKREIEEKVEDAELASKIEALTKAKLYDVCKGALDKMTRKDKFSEIGNELKESLLESEGEEYVSEKGGLISAYFDKLKKKTIREMVLTDGVRLDGRSTTDIRNIWTEVDYLPAAHGSAIFTRGETQALTSLTIGTKQDQQMIDNALENYYENFILHYNFPALSVGEVKPMRGPGRREVGHANLAGRSLKQVLPVESPYTIRIVSDILESNGSSSMATVCAGTLALMDAGIPIHAPVSGIAMGMIAEGSRVAILSDILGDEDAIGDMDFKVTGTTKGITGCQMDIKIDGLPYEMLEKALMQAKAGRIHILNEMNKTLSAPNVEMKPHAPRIIEFKIEKEYIGAVIGPGGKVIQELQAVTGTTISISEVDDKGVVNIYGPTKESIDRAKASIDKITFTPQVGDIYDAVVASVMPYGIFVDFRGKSGLVHISELSHERLDKIDGLFNEGDTLQVKMIGLDSRTGKIKLSRKAILPRPERRNEG